MALGVSHRAQIALPVHFAAPDRATTYIGETLDLSSTGFSVQVRTDDSLPPIILAGILPDDASGEAIVCKARLVWRGGIVRDLKRASYRVISIAPRSQERLDALIARSLAGLVETLRGFPALAGCTTAELELLLGLARSREIPAGSVLYESSATHAGIYLVLRGEVALAGLPARGSGSVVGGWPETPGPEATATAATDLRVLHLSHAVAAETEEQLPRVVSLLREALARPQAAPASPASRVRVPLPKEVLEIPTLPPIFHGILECLADPEMNEADLALILAQDPALATRLLASPGADAPETIEKAVERLGFAPAAHLALTAVLLGALSSREAAPLWAHSVATACFADLIEERTVPCAVAAGAGARGEAAPRGQLFVAGLLHDIGLIVRLLRFPGHYALVRDAIPRAGSLEAAERELLEVDHGQLGYRVAKAWRLPEPLAELIRGHHAPRADDRTLTALSLADVLARRCGFGAAMDVAPPEPRGLGESLGLTEEDLDAIAARAPQVGRRTESLLQAFLV